MYYKLSVLKLPNDENAKKKKKKKKKKNHHQNLMDKL